MTSTAAALLGVTFAFAGLNWWAVSGDDDQRSLELIAKPATLASLIGVALALDPADPTVRIWFVGALVLCLAGDVFLLFAERYFVFGLGSFLLGHLAYVGGFVASGDMQAVGAVLGAGLVAGLLATLGRSIFGAVRANQPELTVPVVAYMGVISLMVVAAIATKNTWAIAGALLFYASDACIAWGKFIEERPHWHLIIMVTYHLGQVGLVLSLI
jgi:uncharacterized membrane protein YhhN